jgi:hypothetical protein
MRQFYFAGISAFARLRPTKGDFAFWSADTKLGRFGWSFFSGVPLPGGLDFAFWLLCETLYLITAWGREWALFSWIRETQDLEGRFSV